MPGSSMRPYKDEIPWLSVGIRLLAWGMLMIGYVAIGLYSIGSI